ncbi:MAG: VOC family protein [Clostridiaceae bacterium]
MIITPNLHFNGECEQALKLYEKVFRGRITTLMHYSDADPSDLSNLLSEKEQGYVYHAEMIIGSQRFMFSDSLDKIPFGRNLSIVVTFESVDEVKDAYSMLSVGGSDIVPLKESTYSTCIVSLVDRFGVRWELMTENNS